MSVCLSIYLSLSVSLFFSYCLCSLPSLSPLVSLSLSPSLVFSVPTTRRTDQLIGLIRAKNPEAVIMTRGGTHSRLLRLDLRASIPSLLFTHCCTLSFTQSRCVFFNPLSLSHPHSRPLTYALFISRAPTVWAHLTLAGTYSDWFETGDQSESLVANILGQAQMSAGYQFEIPSVLQACCPWFYRPFIENT